MSYHSRELAERNRRELAERRRTERHDHIDAYAVVWSREFMARQRYQYDVHWRAWIYHLHPEHRPAWMLNPFLVDASQYVCS
jgi:hypothetical protein